MRTIKYALIILIITAFSFSSCNNQESGHQTKTPMIKEENIAYKADSANLNGFMAFDSSFTAKRPVVIIIHEWWGLNDYVKSRARQLAEMGYLAFAIDMYGDGKMGNNPGEASNLAMPIYQNPQLAKGRFDAAMALIKANPVADPDKTAAIGYCFGGSMVLNMARMGGDLKGVVSFHGNLIGVPADKSLLKAKILVCHGADDQFVKPEEVEQFKKQLDSIGADYKFISYPGSTHAFSNPNATKMGEQFKIPIAYNAAADSASWKDMQDFFGRIFK